MQLFTIDDIILCGPRPLVQGLTGEENYRDPSSTMTATVKRKLQTKLKPAKKPRSDSKAKAKEPPEFENFDDEASLSNAAMSKSGSNEESDKLESSGLESDSEREDSGDSLEANNLDEMEGLQEMSEASLAKKSEAAAKRKEQKQLQKERKMRKTHGKEIEQIKVLWEKLREKQGVNQDTRSKLMLEIMQLVDAKWKDLVFRHDASRVVQTVFKYADKALRQEITVALKGTYVALAKSAYGKYLLVKMMHYGSAKVRGEIIDEMHGSFRKLMGHKEGAYVLEDCYREYATAKQKRQIMREFYGSEFAIFKDAGNDKANLSEIIAENPDKRPYLLQNLNKVITQAVGKGSIGFEIVHAMMLEYIRNMDRSPKSLDRENFIDLIADDFVEMVHTNAGSHVASLALAISTAKERKRLLKSLRQYSSKLAKDNFGNIVMMASFMTIDDTKLTHKAFSDVEPQMAEILCDRFARRPFLMLIVGHENKKFFGVLQRIFSEINEFKKEFSKKDDDVRRIELLESFKPALISAISDHTSELAKESVGMQTVLEILLSEATRDPMAVEALLKTFDRDITISKSHPLKVNPFSGRAAKSLVRNIPDFRNRLADIVEKYPVDWASGEGCFAVVALLETLDSARGSKLREVLRKHIVTLKKSDAKGIDILMGLIQKQSLKEEERCT